MNSLASQIINDRLRSKGCAVIEKGINVFDEIAPDYAAGVDIIDHHSPEYAQRLCDKDVLAIMFGVLLVEGRRGVWRVQNSIFERTGILVIDELARVAISQCTQGQKRSNKLKEEMGKVKKVDDIAKWFGDGDGLPASSKDHVGLSEIMRALIKTCKGRDVSF